MPDLAFTQNRRILEHDMIGVDWTTILCSGPGACGRPKITEMSLIQLMQMTNRICHKCQDKISKRQLRSTFLSEQEIQGNVLHNMVIIK